MQRLVPPARRPLPARGGFTLIELLVVLLIIAILIALLFPAISGAIQSSREAQVVTDIANFDKALVDFKSRFGADVPSFMVLCEAGADWSSDWSSSPPASLPAGITDAHRRTSRAFIRQVWPEFNFAQDVDIDGDGNVNEVHILNGAECLVFFLGGIWRRGSDPASSGDDALIGFAANPQDPFNASSSTNRVGPFYEFALNRLDDVDGDGMPEYRDPLPGQTKPYVYVSSYGGRGYQPWGVNNTQGDVDDELPASPNGPGNIYYSDSALANPLNPQTYQLISPGADGEFGAGGEYNGEGVPSSRASERDNITNFKGGRLN